MEGREMQASIEIVTAAAKSGARSVTSQRQVIEDAAESTVSQWENALLFGRIIEKPTAWAYRVGVNEAHRHGRRTSSALVDDRVIEHARAPEVRDGDVDRPGDMKMHDLLRQLLGTRFFSGQQRDLVVMVWVEGSPKKQAAKALGMDPSSARRSLRRAAARLQRFLDAPPPTLACERTLPRTPGVGIQLPTRRFDPRW